MLAPILTMTNETGRVTPRRMRTRATEYSNRRERARTGTSMLCDYVYTCITGAHTRALALSLLTIASSSLHS